MHALFVASERGPVIKLLLFLADFAYLFKCHLLIAMRLAGKIKTGGGGSSIFMAGRTLAAGALALFTRAADCVLMPRGRHAGRMQIGPVTRLSMALDAAFGSDYFHYFNTSADERGISSAGDC